MADDSSGPSNSVPPAPASNLPPGRRAALRPDAIGRALEAPIVDEELLLDSLVSALTHGEPLPEQWEALHSAAARDDRIAELAFAYEKLTEGTRFRVLSAGHRVEIHLHAADYLLGVFGDAAGAVQHAERALEIQPGDERAFERLRGLLVGGGDALRLAKLHLARLPHIAEEDRVALVRRALGLVSELPAREDASLPLLEELVKLDPSDRESLRDLGHRYLAEARTQDAVRLFERELGLSPPPSPERALELQRWLVRVYVEELGAPHKAIGYLEELLERDPEDSYALTAAEQLLEQRAIAGRAAAVLSRTYQRRGQIRDAASMLTLELRLATGTRRAEVQRDLAILKQDHLDDPKGARELLEPLVSRDPSDDDLRERYVALSAMLDRRLDAARLLSRCAASAKDPEAKARVQAQVGRLFLQSGDERRALASFQAVLETGADDPSVLRAAHELCELYARAGDARRLAKALEHVVLREQDVAARHPAATRLARLCDEIGDKKGEVIAWSALLDSPQVEAALERLEGLSTELKDDAGLARVLERRAELQLDKQLAREYIIRAATLRGERLADRKAAIRTWRVAAERYAVGLEAYQKLAALYEAERDYAGLAAVLRELAPLCDVAEERAKHLSRAGQVFAEKLSDPAGALECYQAALSAHPGFAAAATAVERLLSHAELGGRAAQILESAAGVSGDRRLWVVVHEWRGRGAGEPAERLAAWSAAARLLEQEPKDSVGLLRVIREALDLAVSADSLSVSEWLDRLDAQAASGVDQSAVAELLSRALGSRPIGSEPVFLVARALGEALAGIGETTRAIEVLRRAHAYDPASPGLVGRIEELLAQGGTADERLVFYREALAQPGAPERQRKLQHAMARLLKRELGEAEQAIAVWQQLAESDPADQLAHSSLVLAYREGNQADLAYAELSRMLPRLDGPRRVDALTSLAELALELGSTNQALGHYAELLTIGAPAGGWLGDAERAAVSAAEWALLSRILERKLESTEEPSLVLRVLDRLAQLAAERLDEPAHAAEYWRRAASLAETELGDPKLAAEQLERILRVAPNDLDAAERLVGMHAHSADWQQLAVVFGVVLAMSTPQAAARRVLDLEQRADTQTQREVLAELALRVREAFPTAPEVADMLRLEARLLAPYPERRPQVAERHRELIERFDPGVEALRAFEAFLLDASTPSAADWRWLCERRVASHDDPVPSLLEWARVEDQLLQSPEQAVDLLERVLGREPDHEQALSDLARLRLAAGDVEGALGLLERLRERAQGDAKILAELRLARVLIEGAGRVDAGLEVLRVVLTTSPTQHEAIQLVQQVLMLPDARAKAAELLERISQELDDSATGQDILETLLEVSKDTPELRERRIEWFIRAIEGRESDAPDAALTLCLEGASEAPGEEALWDAAERLARKLERPESVRDAYARELRRSEEAELAELLGRRLIDFYEEWFDEPDRVIELLERVLETAPTAAWALDRLKLAFNAAGRWTDLFRVYDRALARSEQSLEREGLLEEAALAAKDFAGDAARAIGYLEQLLQLRPGDPRVESNLERLYEREGEHRPLIELLVTRIPKHKGAQLTELRLRVAALLIEVKEARQAFEYVEECLTETGPAADAYDLLERILALPVPPESLPPGGEGSRRRRAMSVRDDAAAHLKAYYEQLGQTEDVVRMLEVELEAAPGKSELVERLRELVEIRLTRLNDPEGAMVHTCELVGLAPGEETYRRQLDELARRTDAGLVQAQLLVRVASQVDSPLSEQLKYEAGVVFEREQNELVAIELHVQVAEAEAAPANLRLLASQRLDALLESSDDAARRVDVLEHIAQLAQQVDDGAAERRRVLATAAKLSDGRLGDLARTVKLWRELLVDLPEDEEALDGLVDALERAARHEELVEALDARAGIRTGALAREDRIAAALVYQDKLLQPASAVERWQAIEREFGADAQSFERLAGLLEAEERWAELAARLEAQAAGASDPEQRQGLLVRLGELHTSHTGRTGAALAAYAEARDWEGAMQAVRGVADADGALEACRELKTLAARYWRELGDQVAGEVLGWVVTELKHRLLERGKHQEVVELLLEASELDFSVSLRRAMQREAALLCHERLADPERAAALLTQLIDEDPADEAAQLSVARLALLLDELGRGEAKVRLWEQQAACLENAHDRGGAAALWARAANLAEGEVADVDRAKANYRRGAALGGEESLEALARLYEADGDEGARVAVLEWLCAASSRELLAARVLRLADGYEGLGQRARARERLESALTRAIDASNVRKRLAELYRADKAWVPLAELLAEEAKRATVKRKRRKLFEEAAELYLQRVGNPARAIPLLEQALEAEADDVDLRLFLVDVLCGQAPAEGASHQRAEALLREQLERYGSRRPKSRALVHHRLARVLSLTEGADAALRELEVAAKIDPAHPEILDDLGRIAFEQGRAERAERAYRALLLVLKPGAELDSKGPSRAEAFVYLGEIAVANDDPLRATEFVESAFEAALESEYESKRLEQALRKRGRHELLARVVETRLERASNPAETARALADLVLLYAEEGAGARSAARGERLRSRADSVFESLEQDPDGNGLAWSALGQVYEWLGDRSRETLVLERRVAAVGLEFADAEALYRLAELRLNSSENRGSGVDLLERAFELEPDVERASVMLCALLKKEPGLEEPARLLEAISRAPGREQSLLTALRYLALLGGPRADIVREAYALAGQLGEAEQARQLLEQALSVNPAALEGTDAAWGKLELSRMLEAQGALAKALELREQAALHLDGAEARDLCLAIARQAAEQGQLDRAVRVLERVRQDNPADREAWEPLMALCRERGDSARLAELIEVTLAVVDDAESRARLALERARILLGRGDTAEAIEGLRQIVEEFPGHADASSVLAEVFEQEGRLEDLVQVLVSDLEAAKDTQDVERITRVSLRLGALLERLERADDALDIYQALLDWAPNAAEALRRSAAVLEQREDTFQLADTLERLMPLEVGEAGVELGRRLVLLRRAQADEPAEERALRLLFDAEPRDRDVVERLATLFEAREDYSALADVLARCFEANPLQADLLGRLVLAHRQAGELERALEALGVALTLRANRPELLEQRAELLEELGRPLDALDDHERVYAQLPDHAEQLCAALRRALEATEGDSRRGIQKRLVTVYEERGRLEEAREILLGVLEAAPEDRDTLWRLARIERRLERWEPASSYYQQLALSERGERLIQAVAELLEICNRTGQLSDARAALERAVESYPEDLELSERLRELYAAIGATRELAHLVLRDAGQAPDLDTRFRQLLHAGELLSGPRGHLGEAIGVLEQARALCPDELDGVAALGRAYSAGGRAADARALLAEGVAAQRGRRSRSLSRIYRELAHLDLGAGALTNALDSLNRAFEMDPKNGALAMELGELALDLDDEPVANRAFRAVTMMRPVQDPEEDGATPQARAQAYFHMGRLAHRKADVRKAKIFLAKCLNEDPNNQAARTLMDQLG